MNILFAALSLKDKNGGVDKKIRAQAEALRQLGHQVAQLRLENGRFFLEGMGDILPPQPVQSGPVSIYLGFQKMLQAAACSACFDLVYTRHIFATPFQLSTLRQMKKKDVFTVEEFPTYPYDAEFSLFKSPVYKAATMADKVFRCGYHGLLDMCVVYGEETELFRVPAVSIENGVDLGMAPYVERTFCPKNLVRLVAVSAMTPAHGYERLLEGLATYNNTKGDGPTFTLDMVGDGVCRTEWEALASRLGLLDSVRFHGQLTGSALDTVLAEADMGIATLGWYKKSLHCGSELKVREYMARGLPFVYSAEERLFSPQDGFCLQVPNNNTVVDIQQVASFYQVLCNQKEVSLRLRQFAKTHYTWDMQMKKVLTAVAQKRGH